MQFHNKGYMFDCLVRLGYNFEYTKYFTDVQTTTLQCS
jgi:hypothetical protein